MNKNEKNMKQKMKNKLKNIKLDQKRTMEPFLFEKKHSKKCQKISKYLKISLMLFFKRGFVRLGSVLHIFSGPQKISKELKKIKKSQKISKKRKISKKSFKFLGKKQKNKKQLNKLTQPYNNFAEASGRIAAQLSAVIIFPCVVKC